MSSFSYPMDSVLPWQTGVSEDIRFKKWLIHGLGILLVLAAILPFFPIPEAVVVVPQEEKKQYTRLILEERVIPPVVAKPIEKKPKPIPVPVKKEVAKKTPVVPIVKAKPIVKPKPIVKTKPVDLMKQARDKAAKTGVLAFADDLAAMRQQVDVSKVKKSNLTRGASQAAKSERKLLTAKAKASVGGISSAQLSQDTGGVALSSRETTTIDAPTGMAYDDTDYAAGSDSDYTGRSAESVRQVMDSNKGAVFAIYNRALRKDPSLAGKMLFRMVIEPSGSIASVELLSSELADNALVQKILRRIKMINFGAATVEQTDVNYSFDFLPY